MEFQTFFLFFPTNGPFQLNNTSLIVSGNTHWIPVKARTISQRTLTTIQCKRKAFWDIKITLANTLIIMLANILANHLYSPPTKLIGLKFFKSSTSHFLGINTRKVAFKLLTKVPDSWNYLKKFITSSFTKSQENCQNAIEKPSRPDAFSPQKPDSAPKTSSSEKGFSNTSTSNLSKIKPS